MGLRQHIYFLSLLFTSLVQAENSSSIWKFSLGEEAVVIEHELLVIKFNLTRCSNFDATLAIVSEHEHIARVDSNSTIFIPANEYGTDHQETCDKSVSGSFGVYGARLGRSDLFLSIHQQEDGMELETPSASVRLQGVQYNETSASDGPWEIFNGSTILKVVVRLDAINSKIDFYVMIVISVLAAVWTFVMGCKIDLDVVITIMKKPIPPAIGLACQFMIMPLVSFGLVKLTSLESSFGLGLFTLGCCPGGGGSNMWTTLFDGDLDLSVTMTLLSTVAAFGMMPLWLLTLGPLLTPDVDINIPFINIFSSLCLVLVPCVVGVLVRKFRPNVAEKITRCIKPGALILICIIFIVGGYVNRYMFALMFSSWFILPTAFCLPWISSSIAYGVARLCRQEHKRAITIAIETGIQHIGIALILLKFSLVKPEGDLASVMPVASGFFSPIPLYIAYAILQIRKCLKNRREAKLSSEEKINNNDVKLKMLNDESGGTHYAA